MGGKKENQEKGKQGHNIQTRKSEQTGLLRREQQMPGLVTNPFSLLRRFGEGMERLFQEVGFGEPTSRSFAEITSWAPQVETLTRDRQLIIRADLPGIDKDNVEVEVRDNSVILRGERQEEHREEREGFYRTERSYGSFYREIPLPAGVDTSTAKANFNDGVLEITMTAPESESRGRRLQIQDSQTGEQPKQKTKAASSRS